MGCAGSGRSGVDVIRAFDADAFPVNIAAEVKDFDPAPAMSAKEVRRTASDVHFGVAAAMEAARDAELQVDEPSRVGVVIGSVMGGLSYTLRQQAILEERGWERVSPHWLPNTLVDTTTSHVAAMLGARGLNYATESACATGTHAIGEAAAAIDPRSGRRDPRRRDGVGDAADHPGRLLRDAGAGRRPRRPGGGLAAVRPHPGRVRHGRGCRRGRAGGARARPPARRPDLLRARRLRRLERRLPRRHAPP